METADFQASVQQLVGVLSNPTESYDFVSRHGRNPELVPLLVQVLVGQEYALDRSLRTQAAIMIRNGLEAWYRKLSPHQIDPQAKVQLGRVLVDQVLAKDDQEDRVIRKHVALCVGKIGKSNLDAGLDNLLGHIIDRIAGQLAISGHPGQEKDQIHYRLMNGCLAGLYQIIQCLVRNRFVKGQLLLREVAVTHFGQIYEIYCSAFSSWTTSLKKQSRLNLSNMFHSQSMIELSIICLKILGQLCIHGWKSTAHQEHLPACFVGECLSHWTEIIGIRQQLIEQILQHKLILKNTSTCGSIEEFFGLINRHLYRYGKMFLEVLKADPVMFCVDVFKGAGGGFGEALKGLVWGIVQKGSTCVTQNHDQYPLACLVAFPERLMIQCLSILGLCTNSPTTTLGATTRTPEGPGCSQPPSLTVSQSVELVHLILQHLLILPFHSLEFWTEDPEGYDNEDQNLMESESEEFDVRSCAAKVLAGILERRPELVEVVLSVAEQVFCQGFHDVPTMLRFEAVYFGLGIAAHHVVSKLKPKSEAGVLELKEWIEARWIPVIILADAEGRIVRRRLAWSLGQIAKEEIDMESRYLIYNGLKCLLENPKNDVATKLAACRSLCGISDWEVSPAAAPAAYSQHQQLQLLQQGLPFLGEFVRLISEMFHEVENLDSQKVLTDALKNVIGRAGVEIKPYAAQLVNMLAGVWAEHVTERGTTSGFNNNSTNKSNSGKHLQLSILVAMCALVEALGVGSQEYHQTIGVFIAYSTDSGNSASLVLLEDGLILWLATVRQAGMMSESLRLLLPRLMELMNEGGRDSLEIEVMLFRSYVMLDVGVMMETVGRESSIVCGELLGGGGLEVGERACGAVLGGIVCVVECASGDVWERWMRCSSCFMRLFENAVSSDNGVVIGVKYILTICRMIVQDPTRFMNLLGCLTATTNTNTSSTASGGEGSMLSSLAEVLVCKFSQVCLDKMDNVGKAQDRKVVAVSLAYLLRVVFFHHQLPQHQQLFHGAGGLGGSLGNLAGLVDAILSVWCGVLAEGDEVWDEESRCFRYAYDQEGLDVADYTSLGLELGRIQEVARRDPVRHQVLQQILSEVLLTQPARGGSLLDGIVGGSGAAVDRLLVEELVGRLEGRLKG